MSPRPPTDLEPRREPQQERSRRMRARILDAALRVLAADGALAFTTTAVADEAGISVGSLYQYFPNKQALVVALHRQAVRTGWDHVQAILDDRPRWSPRRRVVELARWFFATEADEAARMGAVFDDVEVFLRDGGHDDLEAEVVARLARFLEEAGSRATTAAGRRFDAELLMITLERVGKAVAARPLTPRQRDRWATETATMLCDHLGLADP